MIHPGAVKIERRRIKHVGQQNQRLQRKQNGNDLVGQPCKLPVEAQRDFYVRVEKVDHRKVKQLADQAKDETDRAPFRYLHREKNRFVDRKADAHKNDQASQIADPVAVLLHASEKQRRAEKRADRIHTGVEQAVLQPRLREERDAERDDEYRCSDGKNQSEYGCVFF